MSLISDIFHCQLGLEPIRNANSGRTLMTILCNVNFIVYWINAKQSLLFLFDHIKRYRFVILSRLIYGTGTHFVVLKGAPAYLLYMVSFWKKYRLHVP